MKRYLVFFGELHYPEGGMSDLLSSADTLEESQKIADTQIREYRPYVEHIHGTKEEYERDLWCGRWAHVFDIETGHVVWKKS